jgi:hypothetical protein
VEQEIFYFGIGELWRRCGGGGSLRGGIWLLRQHSDRNKSGAQTSK